MNQYIRDNRQAFENRVSTYGLSQDIVMLGNISLISTVQQLFFYCDTRYHLISSSRHQHNNDKIEFSRNLWPDWEQVYMRCAGQLELTLEYAHSFYLYHWSG